MQNKEQTQKPTCDASSTGADSKTSRIRVLDGLRAFAIIFVLLAHSTSALEKDLVIKFGQTEFQSLFFNGWVGVDLFFVLSGFLITAQLLRKTLNMKNLKVYALRRFFRIAPAYYIVVVLTLIVYYYAVPILVNNEDVGLFDFAGEWISPLLAHFAFLHDYVGRDPIINGLFWSIPIEIKFYLFLPVILVLIGKMKDPKKQVFAIAAFFVLYVVSKYFLFYSLYGGDNVPFKTYFLDIRTPFHLSLDGLIIGVLCAFILKKPNATFFKPNSFSTNILFSTGLLLFSGNALFSHLVERQATFFDQALMVPLFAFSFGLMLIALVRGCSASSFFENRFLGFIALISYSLYLSHLFIISFHINIEKAVSPYISSVPICWIVVFLIFFSGCVILAYALHRAVEKPFLDWSKKRFKYVP